ncbi:MAG: DUF6359 domain-containing protein [Bacteroidaceae bacterium]|nr:DUF6359 domain-containing protein [Bacteroidaceae bacterium]
MKKIFKSLMFLVMGAFALASCEDVPAPYVVPSGDTGSLPYTSTSLNTDWTTEALNELGNPWIQGSSYTQATGYQKWDGAATKSNKECEGLLTSPALNTVSNSADGVVVAFQYILAYDNKDPQYADHIKLYVYQDNVNGTTPEMSTWTQLPLQLIPRTGSGWDVFNTESIQLPEDFVNKENVRLAFWFYAPADKSVTYELKNFTVQDGKAGGDVDPTGKGSAEDPFEVSDLQASQTGAEVWVHGYIVGSIPQAPEGVVYQLKDMTFTAENASTTNICIAQSPNETEYVNCVPVQITTAARSVLTLASVPDNLGKEVWLKGTSEKYFGSAGLKNVSKYSFTFPIDDEGGQTEEGIPVTCDEAVGLTNALTDGATSTETYTVTGYITEVVGNVSRGQQSFWMADTKDGGKVFEAYYANLPEGVEKFVKNSKVKITGQLTKYVKNGVVTPEIKNAIVEILETGDDSGQGGDEGGDEGTTSEYLSIANMPSTIGTNSYGSQAVADESTWLSWTWNSVGFKAARICRATDANGGGIQIQGNASDAAKQGFIFNSSAWTSDIQKITIVLKVKINADPTKMYDPSYTLYAGDEAHPTTTAITPTSTTEDVDAFRIYTQVFDLANASAKYFTISNNQQGALYIDKIYVE